MLELSTLQCLLSEHLKAHDFRKAAEAANLLPEPQRTKELISLVITSFKDDKSNDVANLLAEPQRTEQLNRVLKRRIEEGWLCGAQDTVRLLSRNLKTEELIELLGNVYKNIGTRALYEGVINLIPESQKPCGIIRTLKKLAEIGMLNDAKILVSFLPEPQKKEWLEVL